MGWPKGVPRKPPEPPIDLPDGKRHGTWAGTRYGCRCTPCRQWRNDSMQRVSDRKRGLLAPYEPPGRTHGTISSYNRNCRCDECRTAAKFQRRRQRAQAKRRAA